MQFDFIVDTQLPPLLCEFFVHRNYNAVHTTNYEMGHLLTDSQIREIAIKENRIIVTKDDDFIDYFLIKGAPPKVLLIETGNISNKDLLVLLSTYFEEIIIAFEGLSDLVIVQNNCLMIY